ncbi:YutD family protein [Levilactobacillus tujiorum]|uniref:YutD family protein n=1 Tax=Levilactobacillus tujiorum TaxID=2912243 RepID=A0ABX1L5K2_9LACO|nr:YutD family protein [Levilactobacillus tujiorum]MCH5465327.1 YutD family protein [Levilactobacillus tujiorum]NLR12517.1 YutD family protein [Lactobacillus sp. HBUAS51387]NLR30330.1 YutD family protein [Levilactobacillus tujiorum]
MTTVDRKDLEALVAEQRENREPAAEVVRVDETHLTINGHPYEVVADVRDGFDFDEFSRRFSTILSKFDYIVGDWGFEQLRLKGFYAEDRAGAKQNQIDAVQDYLYESCNFGCAYFILHNLDVKAAPKPRRNRSRRRNGNKGTQTNQNTAKTTTNKTANQPRRNGADKSAEPSKNNGTGNSNHRRRSRHSRRRRNNHPFTEERRTAAPQPKETTKTVTVATGGQGRRHFTIRQKKED